ncbi:hypothetical protein KAR91_05970 [Candidatus Pacearchaeota archaeon]|nr:hypothetical protein [Candidatus Pacearchaeota archaeon]
MEILNISDFRPTNLIGRIRVDQNKAKEFLLKLEILMDKYEVEDIDVCWKDMKHDKLL